MDRIVTVDAMPWQGFFVGSSQSHEKTNHPAPYFRRDFTVEPQLVRARLHLTALGLIEAYVNGVRVGDEVLCPGWTSYKHRVIVSSHDVTDLVTEGANAVGAIVGEGWAVGRLTWENKRAIWSDRPAAYIQLELEYEDRTEVIATDDSWRTATGSVLEDGIYDGERFDARLTLEGWASAMFDDSAWELAQKLPLDLGVLERREAPPIRRTEELEVVELITTPSGLVVADFGQVISGWVRIAVEGPAGTIVTLRHCELLVDGEPEFETNRSATATDVFVLRGDGLEIWEPRFTFHGFRYAVIDGWPGELRKDDLKAIVVHSDVRRTGWFECSDERINQLHANAVWSFRGNAVGLPTDCPQRDERCGWTGDINAFGPTACFLYEVDEFLTSWLKDVAAEQEEKGGVPIFVPDTFTHGMTPTALWGDVVISLPWVLFQEYADKSILQRQLNSMETFAESIIPHIDESGLWSSGFQFGDWLDPETPPDQPGNAKTESRLIANAYLIHTLGQLESICRLLDRAGDAERWADLRTRVLASFRSEWVTAAGRMANETQTAYALAICFQILDEEQIGRAGQRLAELVSAAEFHIGTGFAGTPWLLHALTRAGQEEVAYHLLMQTSPPSFLYPVTMGATTIWERWDAVLPDGRVNATGMTSLNHYTFGSVADWLHKVVGGLEGVAPGYRRIKIAPRPGGGISWARVTRDTPHGRISVEWRTTSLERMVQISLPDDVTADVVLPDHPDELTVTVEGGTHEWRYEVQPGVWSAYTLETPFSVLKADHAVWTRLGEVVNTVQSGAADYLDYVARQYSTLQAAIEGVGGIPEGMEDELQSALVKPETVSR